MVLRPQVIYFRFLDLIRSVNSLRQKAPKVSFNHETPLLFVRTLGENLVNGRNMCPFGWWSVFGLYSTHGPHISLHPQAPPLSVEHKPTGILPRMTGSLRQGALLLWIFPLPVFRTAASEEMYFLALSLSSINTYQVATEPAALELVQTSIVAQA